MSEFSVNVTGRILGDCYCISLRDRVALDGFRILEKFNGVEGEYEVEVPSSELLVIEAEGRGVELKKEIPRNGDLLLGVDFKNEKVKIKKKDFLINNLIICSDDDFSRYVINGKIPDKQTEIFVLRQSLDDDSRIERKSAFYTKLSYKAIESENFKLAEEMLNYLRFFAENEANLKAVSGKSLKSNGHQQFSSVLTASWHLCVLLEKHELAYEIIEKFVKQEKPDDFYRRIQFSKNYSITLFLFSYLNMAQGREGEAVKCSDLLYDYIRRLTANLPEKIPSDAQLNDLSGAINIARLSAALRKRILIKKKLDAGKKVSVKEVLIFERVSRITNPKRFSEDLTRINPEYKFFHTKFIKFLEKGVLNVS